MLRDRLVCGINDNQTQWRLLAESDLDFQKAFCIAQAMESADKSVIDLLQVNPHPSTMSPGPSHVQHTVPSEPASPGKAPSSMAVNSLNNGQEQCTETCYCWEGRHKPVVCRFPDVKCHRCGKKGHIVKVCCQKASRDKRPNDPAKSVRHLTTDASDADFDSVFFPVYPIWTRLDTPIEIPLSINRKELVMELDTGAGVSLTSEQTYHRLWDKD